MHNICLNIIPFRMHVIDQPNILNSHSAPLVILTTLSSTSIKVQWTPPPNSDRLPLTYHVNYTGLSRSTTSTTLTLTGLHPYEEYTISVQAGNRVGLSVPVNGTARTYSDGEHPL